MTIDNGKNDLYSQFKEDDDEVAKLYQDKRPGYELVSLVSVGLPVARITVTALTLRRKPIPPIEEFVLKSLDAGLPSLQEISQFLGLEESVITDAMVNLRQAENIDLIPAPQSKLQQWQLTKKGRITLEQARIIIPEERSYTINFDKMLWQPRWYGQLEESRGLLRPKDLRNDSILEIPAYRTKTIELADLNRKEVEKIIRQVAQEKKDKREEERDFIGLKVIQRREHLFQKVLLLFYKQKDGNDYQISFAIDGRLSEEHETAFALVKSGKKESIIKDLKIGTSTQLREAISLVQDKLGTEVIKKAEEYEKQIDSVRQEVESRKETLEAEISLTRQNIERTDNDEEKINLQNKLDLVLAEIRKLQEQLDSLTKSQYIRYLKTYEHRPLLEEALKNSQERLLIISPWIRASAANKLLIDSLELLLKRGVKVFIGYGYEDEAKENRQNYDRKPEEKIKKLAERYHTFVFKRLGDTHCKILICDQKFAIVGSFNWLSFKGDPNRTFRDERSTFVAAPHTDLIDKLFEDEVKRFE